MIAACPGRAVLPVLMAAGLMPPAPPAQAQTWSGAVGVSSENIYRGIGQSRGDPSLFANLYLNIDGNWVAGVAASSVHPEGRHADTQVSLQLDRRWRLNPDWSARIGVAHYDSTHGSNHAGLRYDELAAAVSWRGRWSAQLTWSPRVNNSYSDFVEQPSAWLWAETGWHQPLGTRFSFDVGLGYADAVHGPAHDYQYANLGFNVALGDASIGIGRIWASKRKYSYELFNFPYELTLPSRQRWVASVMWLF
ncbi:TorF family putative porin [Dokdonella sp.]|uniref:TorF family putative porin n=1 Tax=Dokdonella sp. TaxID=2291710 RepID=UPI0037843EF1